MKALLNCSTLAVCCLALIGASPEQRLNAGYEPVAVLELFTSQGCSSCPPADKLLNEVITEANSKNQHVYGLSFHVDYWDRLGWKDPYSNRQFSNRQRQYARQFAAKGVYTPQEVVNGKTEFVGSNRQRLQSSLAESLSQPATVAISLALSVQKPEAVTVAYKLKGGFQDAVLHVALVSKSTETTVSRGENAGRKLEHRNVVRTLETVPASESGNITLSLPADFDRSKGSIIAYAQARQGLLITGAHKLDL
ncbi:DUF1223 domain-containing protein [Larkinella rosea]|uniref:DUF1223 domain-containing protein n=1 Tax=Larkinella rosea TaxID=2025312 RepID=A0A3P1BIH6_9BACT|nr:DUF1223 domain-containing protein [Larkinella rosea]RRB00910.1 DUF1223 domain-containing protein [Larkinella rosea]